MKVLLIVEACNPSWSSVPFVGYQFYNEIRQIADVTLVTHCRNRKALQDLADAGEKIIFIEPTRWEQRYYKVCRAFSEVRGSIIWPLRHLLQFPLYFFFNHSVKRLYGEAVAQGEYDIVHVLTPMMPRYPYAIYRSCLKTPLVIGPVNGGVPFPKGFEDVGRQEFAYLNFLRKIGFYLVPGYKGSYRHADKILSGSTYTKDWLKTTFNLDDSRVELLYENGVQDVLGAVKDKASNQPLKLLFVGRLVPYKGCDMVLQAMAAIRHRGHQVELAVVGHGPERAKLELLTTELGLSDHVTFTGWLDNAAVAQHYAGADVFCFPSVREFGGAVVMEAMAFGLPCIVVDNGGIGEYVTDRSGFKIAPLSRDYVVSQLVEILEALALDPALINTKSAAALTEASSFRWRAKRERLATLYRQLVQAKRGTGELIEAH